MTIATTLKKARDLLEDPARWTQRVLARNSAGEPAQPEDDDAACFCMVGALACVNDGGYVAAWRFLDSSDPVLCTGMFNDTSTHLEVMLAMDFAILAAKDERV